MYQVFVYMKPDKATKSNSPFFIYFLKKVIRNPKN